MLYVQRTHGDFVYFNDPVGARRPLATAPTGWAWLAACSDEERRWVLAALARQDPKAWRRTEVGIAAARRDYTKFGFILSLGVIHEQLNAVAVPIRLLSSGNIYGLSASGVAAEWPRRKLMAIGSELQVLATELAALAD
jgi:DNA-binding IclR family transcriptional regulator